MCVRVERYVCVQEGSCPCVRMCVCLELCELRCVCVCVCVERCRCVFTRVLLYMCQ